jgi:CDP-4-dehydro-6-deoxyglucose reductase, E1
MTTTSSSKRYLLAERTIDETDVAELIGWLQTNPWLTQGPLVKQFEAEWSAWLGRRHSLFVNSGSSANLLMYYAAMLAGRIENKKVVVPAVSWATTVAPAVQLGLEPIMCEADWQTFGLDLQQLEQLCEQERPGVVIVVHTLGVPNQMDALLALKQRYDFVLMEDTCPATGSTFRGQHVGTFGDMASFSFYFGHHLSTIEGGMISTDDEELFDILLHIRSHGWAKDVSPEREAAEAAERGVLQFNRPFTFYHPGFNVRSTDLNARIGLSQMRKADHVVRRRVENQKVYERRFGQSTDFHFPSNPQGVTCSISFVALAASNEHRDRVGAALAANNIETRPLGGGSMGRQPYWADRFGARSFPVADAIHERSFMLPNNPDLTPDDIELICDVTLAVPASVEKAA